MVDSAMTRIRHGFTLVEVMASLLVLTVGLTTAAGLMFYAMHLVRASHGQTIGMATAMTILADPSPLSTDPLLTPNGATTSGYLNGLWVERRESDEISLGRTDASVLVNIDVYDANGGTCLVSVNRRMIKKN